MKKEQSSESRTVHAARAALATYLASDKNIDVIRNIPISHITRYDVWQCVFAKEKEAYKELQRKEWYSIFTKYNVEENKMLKESVGTLAVIYLEKLTEFKSPLSIKEGIALILDCFGNDFLPILINEANISLQRRIEIVKPYFKEDGEWIGYSKSVLNALKRLNKQ